MPATCTAPDAICTFAYSEADTPSVSSVSPNTVTITSAPLTINIYGEGFHNEAALNKPLIDDEPCLDVTAVAPGHLRCRVPYNIKAGSRKVTVQVAGKGLAVSSAFLQITSLKMDGPQPKIASPTGMTMLNVSGRGFDGSSCNRNVADIDGDNVAVLGCGSGGITLLYPGAGLPNSPAAAPCCWLFVVICTARTVGPCQEWLTAAML